MGQSRGPGKLQRALWETILQHGKPMTFDDIRAVILQELEVEAGTRLRLSFERSLRRALHRIAEPGGELIVIGEGGRADPYRYFIHPLIIGMMGKTQKRTRSSRRWKRIPARKGLRPNVWRRCLAKFRLIEVLTGFTLDQFRTQPISPPAGFRPRAAPNR
jgi:hypothetical protein